MGKTRKNPAALPDDAKVCNCAECGVLLVSEEESQRLKESLYLPPRIIHGRIKGRPYCASCLELTDPEGEFTDDITTKVSRCIWCNKRILDCRCEGNEAR